MTRKQPGKLTQREKDLVHTLLNGECDMRMPSRLVEAFIAGGERVRLRRGQTLIGIGDTDDNLYIVLEGVMRVWYLNGKQEVTFTFGMPGSIVHPMHCYYRNEASSENYTACCPVKLLKIRKEHYDKLLRQDHEFALWNLRLAQCQVYHYEMRRKEIKGDARERYNAMVRHRPDIVRIVPLKVIATYLGITPEYLSSLRAIND